MTTKAAFNAEEWPAIVNAPYLTAMLVMAASRGGRMRETLAIAQAYASARQHYREELLQQILTTPPSFDPTAPAGDPDEFHQEALATLRRALSTLTQHATEDEINPYKRFVYFVAETVAQAHREGGFLGMRGKQVSDPEQARLDEIAGILDESPALP